MVTSVTGEGDNQQVRFTNPWGREETMSAQDFKALLKGYTSKRD